MRGKHATSARLYLNGWYPGFVLNGDLETVWRLHVADPLIRNIGEWQWVGRV